MSDHRQHEALLTRSDSHSEVGYDTLSSQPGNHRAGDKDTTYHWRRGPQSKLVFVFIALYLDYLLLTIVIPIIPVYLEDEGFSELEVGILFASKSVVQICANIPMGYVTDRFGPFGPLAFGLSVVIGSTVLFAFARSYTLMLIARAIQGLGSSSIMTGGMALLAMSYPPDERGVAMGSAIGGVGLGVLSGPPLGGWLSSYSIEVPYLVVAGLTTCALILLLCLRTDQWHNVREDATGWRMIIRLLQDPPIATLIGCLVVANSVIAMLEPLLPTWMVGEPLRISKPLTGVVFIAATLSYSIGSVIVGKLVELYAKYITWFIVLGLILLAGVTPLVVLVETVFLEVLALIGIGLGMALVDAGALPTLASIVEEKHFGFFGAIFCLVDLSFSVGYTLGPLIGSALARGDVLGIEYTMVVFSGICALYTPILFLGTRVLRTTGEGNGEKLLIASGAHIN